MGRDHYWKPGSFYRIDDRTGFRVRAERTKKQWNGLIVRDLSWEARQPQDFVRGVRDDQTVPEARPRPAYSFDGNSQSTLAATAFTGQNWILVSAPFAYAPGDQLGITLDADLGIVFLTIVQQPRPPGDFNNDFNNDFGTDAVGSIPIYPPLPGQASSGNWIANWSSPQIQPQNYPGSASGAGGGS